jgi:tryptophan 2,3-dioxygenase
MSDPRDMTYGQYLALEHVLAAQHPISECHDELLFIVIHQTKELWLKQTVAELHQAIALVRADRLVEVHKILSRVSRIQAVMTLSWDVLATMTPADYVRFRGVLGSSSGFQSAQFRQVEALLGFKDRHHLRFQEEGSEARAALSAALEGPSLWDEAVAALGRAGFSVPAVAEGRDWSALYQLAEKLVDIDDSLATWRHKHVVTVERIIGRKMGTGGTSGASYLRSTLERRAFPELWSVRTAL